MSILRIERLREKLRSSGLSILALNPGASLNYFTGLHFHLMERPVVLLSDNYDKTAMVLPELEMSKAAASSIPFEPFPYDDNPQTWQQAFHKAARYLNAGRPASIGVEPDRLRLLELQFLKKAFPGARFENSTPVINDLRMIKDDVEIMAMRKSVDIAQAALLNTLPFIKSGVSEMDIASELLVQLLRAGSQPQLPFFPIVASGPNSANPHAVPTDRKLQSGDLVVIDWGASFNDYYSDLTRTFAIGSLDPELEKIYDLVKCANEAGRQAVKPEVTAGSVDQSARDIIDRGGYGEHFTHRTGHGLGMDAHEAPYIFGENEQLLLPHMTFTVEPGIYLTGRGGVRIEDDVIVTPGGGESLSVFSRELQYLE